MRDPEELIGPEEDFDSVYAADLLGLAVRSPSDAVPKTSCQTMFATAV